MSSSCDNRTVLVLGSGPILVGQGAEFDYAGSQACMAYRSLGMRVVVMNDNPASFMTSGACSDAVLLREITPRSVADAMRDLGCDVVASSFGGQLALNAVRDAVDAGLITSDRVLGTPLAGVEIAEDRVKFAEAMRSAGLRCAEHVSVSTDSDVDAAILALGAPVIVRTSFALGGSGVAVADRGAQVTEMLAKAQRGGSIAERSLLGMIEIEFEIIRDACGHAIAVAGMENFDAVGVHTGDSVVITPIASLDDSLINELRAAALRAANAVGVIGACNVQLAVKRETREWWVIECNPRASRSSAMASKATGYPIARVAALLTSGLSLHDIKLGSNDAPASMEPALDFVAVKIPAWSDSRFAELRCDAPLGVSMRATGESMGIGSSISEAWFKAARGAGVKRWLSLARGDVTAPRPSRCAAIVSKLAAGETASDLARVTLWPVVVIEAIAATVTAAALYAAERSEIRMRAAKERGAPDSLLAEMCSSSEQSVRRKRARWCIRPGYELIDGVAGELDATSVYAYSTYSSSRAAPAPPSSTTALIVGSGPIRIGQGVEFDCCCAEAARDLRAARVAVVTLNCNPETVSTDYDASDALVFDPVDAEAVSDLLRSLPPGCVTIAQLGGQAALDAASGADEAWMTASDQLAAAQICGDREECAAALDACDVPRPPQRSRDEFPVIIRPSHVIGGAGMSIAHDEEEFRRAVSAAESAGAGPVTSELLLRGTEFDVDMLVRGNTVRTLGAVEQTDPPGVHSGDSRAVWPALDSRSAAVAEAAAARAAAAVGAVGACNAQVIVTPDLNAYVIEVNARASRTVTMISRASARSIAGEAARSLMRLLADDQLTAPVMRLERAPVFSARLPRAPLGPVMTSTGERVRVVSDRARA